jgi:plasmanylethanolamine desaturase
MFGYRTIEASSIAAFVIVAIWNLPRLTLDPLLLITAAAIAWLAADLLSGVVHWALDRFGGIHTPVIGPTLIRPFREHHVDAQAMTRHDFIETNGSSAIGALPFLAGATLVYEETFAHALLVFTAFGVIAANQCHKWAHMGEHAPRVVRKAQALGLILRPDAHIRHHRPPYDTNFCTASGWLNRFLNALVAPRR